MSETQELNRAPTRPIAERVVVAVADEKDVGVTDLEPLYNSIDPDSLTKIVSTDSSASVTFSFEGFDVTVRGEGRIELHDAA